VCHALQLASRHPPLLTSASAPSPLKRGVPEGTPVVPVRELPSRPRRNRKSETVRRAFSETYLHPANFILPVFVHDGEQNIPIDSMPGVSRLGWKTGLLEAVAEARSVGVNQVRVLCWPGASACWPCHGVSQEYLRTCCTHLPKLTPLPQAPKQTPNGLAFRPPGRHFPQDPRGAQDADRGGGLQPQRPRTAHHLPAQGQVPGPGGGRPCREGACGQGAALLGRYPKRRRSHTCSCRRSRSSSPSQLRSPSVLPSPCPSP
jgi:hypothetical protein